jgi:hypothetical protein
VTLFKITPNALAGLKKLDLEIKFSWIYLYNIINKMAQIGKIFTSGDGQSKRNGGCIKD